MQSDQISSHYSYVVRSDSGFAPNPFGEYCTLACCKPQIRRHASVGDWLVGSGSKRTVGNEKMVYAMQITEKLSFDEYAEESAFVTKFLRVGLFKSAAITFTARMQTVTGNSDRHITEKSKWNEICAENTY